MKNFRIHLALLLVLLAAAPFSQSWAAGSEKGILVASLVRNMGYGGGVHHFRNYVLRGTDKYREREEKSFNEAATALAALRAAEGLTAEERRALDDIEAVIQAYMAMLPVVQEAYERERSLANILNQVDKQVRIDDAPAIEGIRVLRQAAGPWSPVEEIEYAMGFGGGVDNFKNYLIRQDEQYRERADSSFSQAVSQVVQLRNGNKLSREKSAALRDVELTIQDYHGALPRIGKTLAKAKGTDSDTVLNIAIRGADRTVKIDDGPAVVGLAVLRAD